jgi:hypothetical protein
VTVLGLRNLNHGLEMLLSFFLCDNLTVNLAIY